MILENTTVYKEVLKIFASGAKPVNYFWSCQLHANGKTVSPYRITEIDITRDYVGKFTDDIILTIKIAPGDFDFQVFPYKDNLELTLFRKAMSETNSVTDPNKPVQTGRFKAILLDRSSKMATGATIASTSQEVANRADFKEIKIQLMDLFIEKVRTYGAGFIAANDTPMNVIRTTLDHMSTLVGADSDIAPRGTDIAPNFNTNLMPYVIIPRQIRLTGLPRFIHEKCGGVYGAGFGYYLQKGQWYVYPIYDLQRYNSCPMTLTVMNIPNNRLPGVERSYRTTPTQVIALANGETKQIDMTEPMLLNAGNGVRFLNAALVVEGFAAVNGNKASVSRGQNVVEFIAEPRPNGVNFITLGDLPITSNIPFEKSKMAARMGTYIRCTWENATDDAVFPGMPVKYVYEESGNTHQLLGVVVGVHYSIQINGMNSLAERHVCNAGLTLFVDKNVVVNQADAVDVPAAS